MVGSALVRRLRERGFTQILTISRQDLDLRDQGAVHRWFAQNQPEYVYLAAGTVGGVYANSTRQAEFLYDNMMIHASVVEAARQHDVKKLLYLGSSCIYPRLADQPISEEALLTGALEPTNEGYALAKIAGIRLCGFYRQQYGCNFISAMPTNLYGPNDNFHPTQSHVLPALMQRIHQAKEQQLPTVEIWGSGQARREFMHVDDLADACVYLMDCYESAQHINVGTGVDTPIAGLARMLADVIYPDVELDFDRTKPDGMPRKLLDVTGLHRLGWQHSIELDEGIKTTYDWFIKNRHQLRGRQG